MPTRTQQSDVLTCAYASHGDTKHVLLFPEDPKECFEFAASAFDLADRLQTPVFVMTDLDIGMNERLREPLAWDDSRRYDRGKVMTHDDLESGKEFGRYLDVDGDGIPYRTYPGTHPTPGRLLHPRHDEGRATRATPRRGRTTCTTCSGCCKKFETAKALVPAAGADAGGVPGALRRDLLRLDQPGDARGARGARGAGHLRRTRCACARSRSRTRSPTSSPRTPRCSWSSRTATRS